VGFRDKTPAEDLGQVPISDLVTKHTAIFTARRYASTIYTMALCPSVSVISRCSVETDERIAL